jgi:hypothetical protein
MGLTSVMFGSWRNKTEYALMPVPLNLQQDGIFKV